ncbi:MAG: outer membrane beta-barrel protein [Bacteroidales bacterium]
MSDEKKNIDLLFRESIKGFRTKSPPHAWERLERDLNTIGQQRKIFYIRLIAASLLVFIAFGAGYFYATFYSSGSFLTDNNLSESTTNQETEGNFLLTDTVSYPEIKTSASSDQTAEIAVIEDVKEILSSYTGTFALAGNSGAKDSQFHNKSTIPLIVSIQPSSIELSGERLAHHDPAYLIESIEKTIEEPIDLLNYNQAFALYDDPLPPTNAEQLKWKIGAQFAPTYSYREISTNYEYSGIGGTDHTDELNMAEEALLSYSGGVNIDFKTGKRWGFQTGLYYARVGQINNDALKFELVNNEYQLVAINTSTGFIHIAYEKVPDDVKKVSPPKDDIGELQLDNVSLIQQFDLFEVPLLIKYRVIDTRFFVNLAGGLSPAYLLKNQTWLEVEGEKHDIGLAVNLNSVIVNSSIGIGLGYDVSTRLSFSLEPTFRYALNPINKNSEVYYHPYYLSWFTGFSYKF